MYESAEIQQYLDRIQESARKTEESLIDSVKCLYDRNDSEKWDRVFEGIEQPERIVRIQRTISGLKRDLKRSRITDEDDLHQRITRSALLFGELNEVAAKEIEQTINICTFPC